MLDYAPRIMHDLSSYLVNTKFSEKDRALIQLAVSAIDESQKFILPTGAFRNVTNEGISDTEIELFKPPFVNTLWEYEYPEEMQIVDNKVRERKFAGEEIADVQYQVTGRVNMLLETDESEHDYIFLMFHRTKTSKWVLHPCTLVFNVCDLHKDTIKINPSYMDYVYQLNATREERDSLASDMGYEVATTVKAISMLNCENVEHTPVQRKASKLKTSTFKKKYGVEPYQYRVLHINGEATYNHNGDVRPRGKGVRYHLRRGHFRHLQSGKVIWVRACKVGDMNIGQVEKVYDFGK